jgi:hypothetical protein
MSKSITQEKTELTRSAMTTCRSRGHVMTKVDWEHQQRSDAPKGFGDWHGYSKCKTCGMYLKLETNPSPNSTSISGESVALNCRYKHMRG